MSAGALLRSRRAFRNLWLALTLSYTGSGLALTALVLYVQRTQGTGVAVAALLIAQTIPRLLGPVAGGVADRTDLRRLMIACDVGQAGLFAVLATLPAFGPLLALTALASLLQTAYVPARTTALPALVEPAELMSANALLGTSFNVGIAALGPLLGGLLVAGGGAKLALLVNAGSFALSAIITSRLPALAPTPPADGERSGLVRSTRDGLSYAMRDPVPRAVTLTLLAVLAFLAMDNVSLVFLVRDTLDGGAAAFGIASAAFGLGMVAGSVGLLFRQPARAGPLYLAGLAVSSGGTLLTGLAPVLGFAIAFQAVAGGGNGVDNVAHETLLQQHVTRPMQGRVFGLTHTAAYLGMGVASALGGVFLDLTSPRTVFVAAGVGGLAAALLATRTLWQAW